jgi:hypothetical protein
MNKMRLKAKIKTQMKDKLKMYIINEADKEDVYIHKGWMHFFTYHLDGEYSD